MKLNETFTYPDTDVESVYALISDREFRVESAEVTGATDVEVTVEPTDAGHTVTVARTQPADMPDSIKRFTGDTVKVKQTEQWGGPDGDGTREAAIKVSIIGQPAEMLGTATLTDGGDVTFVVKGDVKVNVPFVGKKIEPQIAKAITGSVRSDVELGKQRLQG